MTQPNEQLACITTLTGHRLGLTKTIWRIKTLPDNKSKYGLEPSRVLHTKALSGHNHKQNIITRRPLISLFPTARRPPLRRLQLGQGCYSREVGRAIHLHHHRIFWSETTRRVSFPIDRSDTWTLLHASWHYCSFSFMAANSFSTSMTSPN